MTDVRVGRAFGVRSITANGIRSYGQQRRGRKGKYVDSYMSESDFEQLRARAIKNKKSLSFQARTDIQQANLREKYAERGWKQCGK